MIGTRGEDREAHVGIKPGAVVLGRYRVGAVVGRGGMAVVYEGDDLETGRLVAIKVLAPQLAQDPEFRRRFIEEARAARKLPHPNIVQVYDVLGDVGSGSGRHGSPTELALIFELVRGETLAERLARSPIAIDEALRIAGQITSALGFAHTNGVIHRDVKPGNILLGDSGAPGRRERVAKLADFGIARAADTTSTITAEGQVLGSLPYVAPEVLEGKGGDARSDVYALGVTLFRMLAGTLPFHGETAASLAQRLTHDAPRVRSSRPDTPEWLDDLVARALARDPAARFSDGAALHQALQRPLQRPSIAPDATTQVLTIAPPRVPRSVPPTPRRLPALVGAIALVSLLMALVLRSAGDLSAPRASAASTPAPTEVPADPTPTAIVIRPR